MNPTITSSGITSHRPASGEIRSEADRILSSAEFQKARRLRPLFAYLIDLALLAAPPHMFTENAIYVDFFASGEPDAIARFDCHRNRIVGVSMYHLKAKLRRYNEGSGAADAVVIDSLAISLLPAIAGRTPERPSE